MGAVFPSYEYVSILRKYNLSIASEGYSIYSYGASHANKVRVVLRSNYKVSIKMTMI